MIGKTVSSATETSFLNLSFHIVISHHFKIIILWSIMPMVSMLPISKLPNLTLVKTYTAIVEGDPGRKPNMLRMRIEQATGTTYAGGIIIDVKYIFPAGKNCQWHQFINDSTLNFNLPP